MYDTTAPDIEYDLHPELVSGSRRLELCVETLYEIEALARALPQIKTGDSLNDSYAIRGIAGRIVQLTEVLQNAITGDMNTNTDALALIVNLETIIN